MELLKIQKAENEFLKTLDKSFVDKSQKEKIKIFNDWEKDWEGSHEPFELDLHLDYIAETVIGPDWVIDEYTTIFEFSWKLCVNIMLDSVSEQLKGRAPISLGVASE